MSENAMALVIGGGIALLSFGLAVVWDLIKFNREQGQKDEAILFALKQEMTSNVEIMKTNVTILTQEIGIIDQGKQVVEPLNLLENSSWDFLKIQIPHKLTEKVETLTKIKEASQVTSKINETIKSRENYRINNGAMSNFSSRMKLYDQILVRDEESLVKAIEGLLPKL